jgi:hypothetical protein
VSPKSLQQAFHLHKEAQTLSLIQRKHLESSLKENLLEIFPVPFAYHMNITNTLRGHKQGRLISRHSRTQEDLCRPGTRDCHFRVS